MNKTTIGTLLAGAALAAASIACGDTATNNANGNTTTSNTAVVTNNNGNTNTAGISNTNNSNTATARGNRNYNMSREEYDKDDVNYRKEAKEAGDSIGTTLSDGWIHLKTRGALAAVDDLRDSTINVDVDNGVITLRGTVGSQAHIAAADKAAKGIEGVKSVKNTLKVGAAGSGNGNANGNANANAKGTASH